MIQWKLSAVSFALGAVTSVGFVWLRRSLTRRAERRAELEAPFDPERAARSDALHDVAESELDFIEAADAEPSEVEPSELLSYEQETFEPAKGGERYDAVDPEEVGAEWLQRLTNAFPKFAWINPEPQGVWQYRQSISVIQQLMNQRMYPLTIKGLEEAMRLLSK